MAGIGFELRRLLRDESLLGLTRAYAFAGLVSAGPWVFSIVSVLAVGTLGAALVEPRELVTQFLVSVTYLMAASLIVTGPLQLLFSRYVADRVYEKRLDAIVPNMVGALTVTTLGAAVFGALVLALFFDGTSLTYRALMLVALVTLCDGWLVVVLLSGLKAYRAVLGVFAAGNAVGAIASIAMSSFGLEGLLAGFLVGQVVLLFGMVQLVVASHPCEALVSFEFLQRRFAYPALALTGLLYNLGIWADKLLFWADPLLSEPAIGPLRFSVIYDLPIFLAYLSVIPGMAVFLLRIETDFAEQYERFFASIRDGATLGEIESHKDGMVLAVRSGLYDIFKLQGLTVLMLALAGPRLLALFDISPNYARLLGVDIAGVATQVLLLAILSVLFYLDERRIALVVTGLFCGLNVLGTLASQALGPAFYGYGFAVAAAVASLVGLLALSRSLDRFERRVFMTGT